MISRRQLKRSCAERGASAPEYSLLAALIAVGLATVLTAFGTTLSAGYTMVTESIASLSLEGDGGPDPTPGNNAKGVGRGGNNGSANGHGSGSGGDGGNSGQGPGSNSSRNP